MSVVMVATRPCPRRIGAAVRGFSLVEVLVSMFVVAMGILALAGLLQSATRYAKMSELRSTATLLANDIADRMRANPIGAALGADGYDLADTHYPSAPAIGRSPCTAQAPCRPADLAHADMADWTARLRATLPRGSAWVKYHAGKPSASDYMDVWVGWTDPNILAPGGGSERSGTECPVGWKTAEPSVRCIYLQVAL